MDTKIVFVAETDKIRYEITVGLGWEKEASRVTPPESTCYFLINDHLGKSFFYTLEQCIETVYQDMSLKHAVEISALIFTLKDKNCLYRYMDNDQIKTVSIQQIH